ncbi:MAG: DUF6428 family protein [Verrucomicrobiales bacterium]|nr:DUF6428 family protein [Verrucomicrobiales bacterium]
MKLENPILSNLIDLLQSESLSSFRIILPDGKAVPSHFHVTEVGRVRKDFIDCGGTVRQDAHCQLQLLIATDFEHRLASSKLLKIIEMSAGVLGNDPLPLTVEYGQKAAVVYPVSELEIVNGTMLFRLETPTTACLAADACGLSHEEARTPSVFPQVGRSPEPGCC